MRARKHQIIPPETTAAKIAEIVRDWDREMQIDAMVEAMWAEAEKIVKRYG